MGTLGMFNSIHHRQIMRQRERNDEYLKRQKEYNHENDKSTIDNQQYNFVNTPTPDTGSIMAAKNFIYCVEHYTKLHIRTEYDSTEDYFKEPVDLNNNKANIITIFNNGDAYEIKLEKFNEDISIKVKFIIDVVVNNRSVYTCNTIINGYSHLIDILNNLIHALKEYSQFSTAHELEKCL